MEGVNAELERLERAHRRRRLTVPRGIDFSSNDYLGLAAHPALRAAIVDSIERDGRIGAGGSRLLRGHHEAHEALETRAAQFFGVEKALYFGSGFLANFALFTTLLDRHDAVIFDESIHASVKEGAHASPAARYKARHNDVSSFEHAAKRARSEGARRVLIAVESLYSMDGDLAPLQGLDQVARGHDAVLVVDEAHATGVFGARGRGFGEGLQDESWISLHTCGKALGVAGALVCASAEVIDYLVNKARPFIYSTAPPPCLAAAVTRSLDLVDEEPWRRKHVLKLAAYARSALKAATPALEIQGESQIIPVLLGTEERAMSVAQSLQDAGFDARAIRPPTVPGGTSRLRLSINAVHSERDIDALAAALAQSLAMR